METRGNVALQVIARFHSSQPVVRRVIRSLLVSIWQYYPQAVMCQLLVACKSQSSFRRSAAMSVAGNAHSTFPTLLIRSYTLCSAGDSTDSHQPVCCAAAYSQPADLHRAASSSGADVSPAGGMQEPVLLQALSSHECCGQCPQPLSHPCRAGAAGELISLHCA